MRVILENSCLRLGRRNKDETREHCFDQMLVFANRGGYNDVDDVLRDFHWHTIVLCAFKLYSFDEIRLVAPA